MSELRIIPVVFGGKHFIITDHRMQYDYGQVLEFKDLELPDSFEARFSNSPVGESIGQIGTNNRIRIPKQFFESGDPIYCYITLHDEVTDGRTVYTTKVPIKPSTERTEEEPEPEEESLISQAITALNSAVTTTTQKAQEASASADRAEHAAESVEGYAERAESAQSASESARDIALEAKVSAQASAATASEKASEAISSAATASQSALTAEGASESASASATASAESAEQASQSADTASGKASDASGYASSANTSAQTATQKALEAAQGASTATQAKTDAITAKTASETAQGLAESARDGAVTAKADAEQAKIDAQAIADGITGKVEQIDSNTERIESLEDDRYKPYVTDTASGAVASFPDGADDIPLKSCIVQVNPVQAGSGDPSPDNIRPISGWAGCEVQRTGKNLVNWADKTLLNKNYIFNSAISLPKGTYTLSFNTAAIEFGALRVMDIYGQQQTTSQTIVGTLRKWQIESTENIASMHLYGSEGTYSSFQLEVGSTATAYEPYSGDTYPIAFPSSAGTVYGGTLDVINGELVIDRGIAVFDGTEPFYNNWFPTVVCNKAFPKGNADGNSFVNSHIPSLIAACNYANSAKTTFQFAKVKEYWGVSSADELKATFAQQYANGTPVTICYPLAEPIHYPITPTEIKTLLGQNNIWADTGDTEVEYRADTKLFINKKIAEALASLT